MRSALARLPTALTLLRFALAPTIAGLVVLATPMAAMAALTLFLIAAATDWLDGFIARRAGAVSALGARLDPWADKALIAAVLVPLLLQGSLALVPALAAAAILVREAAVLLARLKRERAGEAAAVSAGAKWKTALQLLACGALVAVPIGGTAGALAALLGELLLYAAALVTLATGADYWRRWRGTGR